MGQKPESDPSSFMSVRRTTTQSGNAMTFVADRSLDTGHTEAFRVIPPTDILGIRLGDLPAIDTAYPQR